MPAPAVRHAATVDDVIITTELSRRPSRQPDHAAENRALVELATVMASSPDRVLQKLSDTALELCRAGSAGVSVWEPGAANVFRWKATSGAYTPYLGNAMPRDFSPCGTVLDRNVSQLMVDPVRFYPYIAELSSPVREVLLVPFHQANETVGTVWVVSHSDARQFDAEDERLVTTLSRFAGAAVQTLARIEAAEVAESGRRDVQNRLHVALGAGRMGAWDLDLATMHMTCSDACKANYGRPPGESFTYEQLEAAVHEDDRARWRAAVEDAIARSGEFGVEYRTRWPDGAVHWVHVRGTCTTGAGGPALSGVSLDVTDRRQAEEELRRLAAELSDADRKKDEFLATLAHELRNPLAPIRNGLQVLTMSDKPEARDRAVAMMGRQLGQMVQLVDDLMDVSRISRGKLELKRERVPLAGVLESAVETSRPLIDQMGHELVFVPPAADIVVDADLTRLAQVFLNLLNNAAKYTERGGRVWFTVAREGDRVAVAVRDTGIGIAADQLPRIFDMFSQVDGSLEKAQGGLGIGLMLVRRLTEMHGGTIEARSDGPGTGSEFVIRLPVVEAATVSVERAKEQLTPKAHRILIVDDNQDGADSLSEMMAFFGNDTRTAYDGEAAVAEAVAFQPDVILLDIGLPKLNGYEACRRIRAQQNGNRPVIIAQTGWGAAEDRERTREAGFDHHLVKPVDPVELLRLLADMQD